MSIEKCPTKFKGLAIFASDAMSSVAYATKEILVVLVAAAASGALGSVVPLSVAIAFMLAVVAFSYRQTVFAFPSGGGSYVVSRENLGLAPGLIAATTKFFSGAWLTIVMIPFLVGVFLVIHRHYHKVNDQLHLSKRELHAPALRQIVIVPLAGMNRASERALAFARGMEQHVYALHVTEEAEMAKELANELRAYDPNVKLIVLESPYRAVVEPLLNYIDALHQQDPDAFVTVVVPEFLTAHWWQGLLHNGTAAQINRALKPHPNVAVVNVPYVLEH